MGFNTPSGRLSLGGSFRFRQAERSPQVIFSGFRLTAQDLGLQDKKNTAPVLSLGRLDVADATFDLSGRKIRIGSLALDDTQLFCRREKDGRLNWVDAFIPLSKERINAPEKAAKPDVELETSGFTEPFVIQMATVDFSDVTVDVVDLVPEEPVHLRMDKLTLSATDLSSEPGQAGRATLRFDWAEAGQVQIGGAVALNPVALDLTVDIKALDLPPFSRIFPIRPGLSSPRGCLAPADGFN